ncbi:putative dioxygenase [Globomyces pollinis-pini]|nr:putative dioxygenase [Globomyces pollinis-pini]
MTKISKLPPFHIAFPVYDLELTRSFYTSIVGCTQGREDPGHWIDFNLFGHQIVAHKVPTELQTAHKQMKDSLRSMVDGHNVPIPHFGAVLEWDTIKEFSTRLKSQGVKFEIEPYLRFEGLPGEQITMFFYDPSGNALEFKSFKNIDTQLFATK